jgi:hypothetical protein
MGPDGITTWTDPAGSLVGEPQGRPWTRGYALRREPILRPEPKREGRRFTAHFASRLDEARIEPPVGSARDSFDDAQAESLIRLWKAPVIRYGGSWRTIDHGGFATLGGRTPREPVNQSLDRPELLGLPWPGGGSR